MLEEIEDVKEELQFAMEEFNQQTEEGLVESSIYLVRSLEAKLNYLIKKAKRKNIKYDENIFIAGWLNYMFLYLILIFIFILVLSFCSRFKNFFNALILNSFLWIALFLTILYFFESYISLNIFSILMTLVAGIPGVLLNIFIKCLV